MRRLAQAGSIASGMQTTLAIIRYFDDFPVIPISITYGQILRLVDSPIDKVYVVQTDTKVVERCMLMTTDPGDLVLDPTCGSGTTAYVAEQWGRRWITIDTSPRGHRPGAHAPDGGAISLLPAGGFARRRQERDGTDSATESPLGDDSRDRARPRATSRRGFVYKRVPHVTLKVHRQQRRDRRHPCPVAGAAGAICARRSTRLLSKPGKSGRSPASAGQRIGQRKPASRCYDEWWKMRRERQKEIDASIARRADTETALRPALRRQQAHARHRAVHGREPVAAPGAVDGRANDAGVGDQRATSSGERSLRP